MFDALKNKEASLAVIGLGYVGLPIALEFARHFKVIGFDINPDRVDMLNRAEDPSKELGPEHFVGTDIFFTAQLEDLKKAKFYVVAVPTPINQHNDPDLQPLLKASHSVGKVLKKGDIVVFESTVYPGCTEEDCVPVLEQESGLVFNQDFFVGYSPERINPGDKEHTLTRIKKVVSGSNAPTLDTVASVYGHIITAGIHKASTIKVAEAAKIIENTQRDLNIALMNELSLIFSKMGINTFEVLEAASTKWNFLKFFPGLVGGHCIGVDPYYLTYKASEVGYHSKVILAGRNINDSMGAYVAQQLINTLVKQNKHVPQCKVLVMGATFKENVSDIRNSKVFDIVRELQSFHVQVDLVDPHADAEEVQHEYHMELAKGIQGPYDAIIVAVSHQEYLNYDENWFLQHAHHDAFVMDIKGIFRNRFQKLGYWSL